MNAKSLKLFMAFGSICLFGTSLYAQSYEMVAYVPFAFHVNKADLAPGKYLVSAEGSSQLESIQSSKGQRVLLTSGGQHQDNKGLPRLVFRRYGSEYFLAEVWNTVGTGTKLKMTQREREVVQAHLDTAPENVAVAFGGIR